MSVAADVAPGALHAYTARYVGRSKHMLNDPDLPHRSKKNVGMEADKSPAIDKGDSREHVSTMQCCAQIHQPVVSFQVSVLNVEHEYALQS